MWSASQAMRITAPRRPVATTLTDGRTSRFTASHRCASSREAFHSKSPVGKIDQFVHGNPSKLHPAHAERIKQILDALDAASPLNELPEPTYRLHPPRGNRSGQWSVRVGRIWRLVFRANGENVFDVD